MDQYISWFATAATILAASVTASNLGPRVTGYGFVIFLFGSIAWLAVGLITGQPALLWTNVALTFLNRWGIWRWLGRQAKLEEGSEAALEASLRTPGEALFPASMLGRLAILDARGDEVGKSVDAMIGGRSGRVHYLVAARGGIAGVGERFHRVDWDIARHDADGFRLAIDQRRFDALPEIARDEWPAN